MEANFFSIAVFSALVIVLLSSVVRHSNLSNAIFLSGSLVYCLLIALRGDSGSDTFLYKLFYEKQVDYLTFLEPGLPYIFEALSIIGLPFEGMLCLQAALCFYSLIILRKTSGSSAVIFYILFFGLNIDFSTLRQSIALHLIIISAYHVKNSLPAIFLSSIHFGALFSLLSRLSMRSFLLYLIPVSLVALFFIQRYLDLVNEYFIRDDYGWIMQTLAIMFFMYAKGYGFTSTCIAGAFSYIPIGYRLLAYIIPVMKPRVVNGRSDFIVALVLCLASPIKLYSFSSQSLQNDGDKSVVFYFNEYMK